MTYQEIRSRVYASITDGLNIPPEPVHPVPVVPIFQLMQVFGDPKLARGEAMQDSRTQLELMDATFQPIILHPIGFHPRDYNS